MMEFLSDVFGPFPFEQYSVVLARPDISICAGNGLSASQQTLTLQCPTPFMTEELTTLHELAHQWFGVSVASETLQDSWLDEGPATYSEWMWLTRDNGLDGIDELARTNEGTYSPRTEIGKPPFDNLVPQEVYTGGALLLHALRLRVGDQLFFEILRTYLARYQYGNGGTDAFIAIAQEVTGDDLQSFFDAWLFQVEPPTLPGPPG
jgi:aminopeptidase N